jgi:hypothetical protein
MRVRTRLMASWPCSITSARVGLGRSANSTALRLDRWPQSGFSSGASAGRRSTSQDRRELLQVHIMRRALGQRAGQI